MRQTFQSLVNFLPSPDHLTDLTAYMHPSTYKFFRGVVHIRLRSVFVCKLSETFSQTFEEASLFNVIAPSVDIAGVAEDNLLAMSDKIVPIAYLIHNLREGVGVRIQDDICVCVPSCSRR